jgi:N-acetylmuramic acid 6-phosphate etherase
MDGLTVGEHDVVVGIAASGSTPYVHAALGHARGLGARTVSLSCSAPVPELREQSDIVIYVPGGPEVVTGSTRMKAGTATKMVLNTLSTGAMIRIGKVYGNLMVDLQAWSDKLVDRGERIVMETTGCDRAHARQAIEEAGGAVKTAIVMVKQSVDRDRAEALIADNDGRLRPILGDPPPVPSHD